MTALWLALLLLAAPPGTVGEGVEAGWDTAEENASAQLLAEQARAHDAWQECLFDRADALAGYAHLPAQRASALALAGCEEKARAFRKAAGRTPGTGGADLVARVEAEMRRYALVVARASAKLPL